MPELIIVAGANGVGKTTFAKPYTEEHGYDFLNADEIAAELEAQGGQSPLIKAGRIFFGRLNGFLQKEQSIVVETTLSGTYINKVAIKAKSSGYVLKVIYIFLDTPQMCIERVKTRRQKGGHDVPEEDVERRFYRSIANFWFNFKDMAATWTLIYNGDAGFQQVATGEYEKFVVENRLLFAFFETKIKRL